MTGCLMFLCPYLFCFTTPIQLLIVMVRASTWVRENCNIIHDSIIPIIILLWFVFRNNFCVVAHQIAENNQN